MAKSRPARPTYLLLDLNGTLHVGDEPTPGAIAALEKLRGAAEGGGGSSPKFGIRFCSNSSKESTSSLVSRLRSMGFTSSSIPAASVFTSLDACAALCHRSSYTRPLLLLNPSAQSTFDAERFPGAVRPGASSTPSDDDCSGVKRCDAVVLGLAPQLMRHEWLDEAFRLLSGEYSGDGESRRKVPLIGTHRAMYLRPGSSSPLSLGPGAFLAALEAAAGLDPAKDTHIVGKPQPAFFAQCLKEMGWKEGEEADVHIVGDDAVQDLSIPLGEDGGKELGLEKVEWRRALVRTGKYRQGDEDKAKGAKGRVEVRENFAGWVEAFLKGQEA